MDAPSREMPRYQSHKQVWALKIGSFSKPFIVNPEEESFAPFTPSLDWFERCKATDADRGYYVVYDDGYASWSPSKAFEDGYTRL